MYENQLEEALEYCDRQWNGLKWSFLMLSQIVRIPILGQRGTVLAAAARRGDTNRRLKRASRDAAKLEREGTPLATALSTQIRALVAWVRGDRTLATTLFLKAAAELDLAEASAQAIAARMAAGDLIGGREGAVLIKEAEDELASRGVVDPRRFGPILSGLHPSAL
jgi:hypothetical protein